jgi:chemotaxis protein CheZ
MAEESKVDKAMLLALHSQIQEICGNFKVIRKEAMDIVHTSQMPDATHHLNDVLQSTEEATTAILEAATAIGYAMDGSVAAPETKEQVSSQIGRIYEACSFQDISGQRIKKVMKHMSALEAQLLRLSETAKGQMPLKPEDSLMNGPQFISQAPSQEDVDQMFAKVKP